MLTIKHGLPRSDFLLIATPYNGRPISDYVSIQKNEKTQLTLKDPKTGEEILTEIHDCWRFKTDEDGQLINAWAKLAYGIPGPKLVTKMKETYPGFSKHLIIDFLLLQTL